MISLSNWKQNIYIHKDNIAFTVKTHDSCEMSVRNFCKGYKEVSQQIHANSVHLAFDLQI